MSATTLDDFERQMEPAMEGAIASKFKKYVSVFADATTSEYFPAERKGFAEHFDKLRAISTDNALWAENAEKPSQTALTWSWMVVQQLNEDDLMPTKIVASSEGGVAVCFVVGDKYADIESLNSGEILGVISNRRDRPFVWEIGQDKSDIARASIRIRKFLE